MKVSREIKLYEPAKRNKLKEVRRTMRRIMLGSVKLKQ